MKQRSGFCEMTRRIFGARRCRRDRLTLAHFQNLAINPAVVLTFSSRGISDRQYYSRSATPPPPPPSFFLKRISDRLHSMFSKLGDGRSFDKFGISRKGSPDGFFRDAEVIEGCCSIKWKNVLFHHLPTFYKTMAHSLRFSTGFGASLLPPPLPPPLIFTFSFLLLRLT